MVGVLTLDRIYGIDFIVDGLIVLVASLIAYQSKKIYDLISERDYKLFFLAFSSIAIAFMFKLVSNFTSIYKIHFKELNFIGEIIKEYLEFYHLLNFFSFFAFKIFLLLGFMILFLVINKNRKYDNILLFVYLGLIAVIFSIYFNFIFYFTLSVIIFSLAVHFYYNYQKKKTKSRYRVFLAFLLVLIGNLMGIIYEFHPLLYLIEELLLFFGFLILLINHLKSEKWEEKGQR